MTENTWTVTENLISSIFHERFPCTTVTWHPVHKPYETRLIYSVFFKKASKFPLLNLTFRPWKWVFDVWCHCKNYMYSDDRVWKSYPFRSWIIHECMSSLPNKLVILFVLLGASVITALQCQMSKTANAAKKSSSLRINFWRLMSL